jgi:hypothetical protein
MKVGVMDGKSMCTFKLCLKLILSVFRGDRRFEKPGRKDVGKVLTVLKCFLYFCGINA